MLLHLKHKKQTLSVFQGRFRGRIRMDYWHGLRFIYLFFSPQVPRCEPGGGKLLQEGKTPGLGQQLGAGEESQGLLYRRK